jgi:hypothetical protein
MHCVTEIDDFDEETRANVCSWHFAAFAATQQMRSLSEQQRTLVATGGENVGSV